eukprot:2954557-Rhodomonas_salina.1
MSRSFEQRELFNAQLAAFNRANTGPYSPPRRAGHAHAHDGAHSSPSAHSTPLRSSALLHPYASPAILDVSNDADVPRHYDDRKALDTEESLLQALARQSKSAAAFLTSSQEVLEKAEIEANARLARTRLMRSEVEVQQLSKIAQSEADSARRAAEDADSMRRRNVTCSRQPVERRGDEPGHPAPLRAATAGPSCEWQDGRPGQAGCACSEQAAAHFRALPADAEVGVQQGQGRVGAVPDDAGLAGEAVHTGGRERGRLEARAVAGAAAGARARRGAGAHQPEGARGQGQVGGGRGPVEAGG